MTDVESPIIGIKEMKSSEMKNQQGGFWPIIIAISIIETASSFLPDGKKKQVTKDYNTSY